MADYLYVRWTHAFEDEPVELYSELDEGRETRKVEVFPGGRAQYAGPHGATGDTRLSETRLPSIAEINQDPQFTARQISERRFEDVWRSAQERDC